MPEKDSVYKPVAGLVELVSDIGMMMGGPSYAFYVSPQNYSTPPHHIGAFLLLFGFTKAMADAALLYKGEAGICGTAIKFLYDLTRKKQ